MSAIVDQGFVTLYGAVPILCAEGLSLLRRAAQERQGWKSEKKLHIEDLGPYKPIVGELLNTEAILKTAQSALGPSCVYLGSRYRAPFPGFGEQTLHADDSELPETLRLVTAILPLVPFNDASGATRYVPGSHEVPLIDAPTDPMESAPNEVTFRADPGDAIIFTGSLWHSGTRNRSTTTRDAISSSYIVPELWPHLT